MLTKKVRKRLSFIINVVFVAVVAVLVFLGLKYVLGWVLPFILAFCIVSLVHPLMRLIKKHLRIKQSVVSLIVMVLIYVLVAGLLFLLIMQIAMLVRDGFTQLMPYYNTVIQPALNKAFDSIMAFIHNLPPQWQEQLSNIQGQIFTALQSFLGNLSQWGFDVVSRMTSSVPSFLIAFVFTIMLSFFISMQYETVVEFIKIQLPPRVKGVISDLRSIVKDTIFKYFKAALTLMVITMVELSIGLMFLRTNNAIPIAAGIAVFDALPFFGTGAIMIPWCLIELLQGNYSYGFGLAILYAIVTVIRNIIEPKIVGDKLGLNPIVSLTAIYVGFKLFGVLGMIFMPILTQIVMELHNNGTIRLFKVAVKREEPEPAPEGPASAPENEEDTSQ